MNDDTRGVCYRPGEPTIADYNEAITHLLAAKHQLQSGSLMGCDVCGDSGHAAQDGCHHDPLILARKWTAATSVWHCWHCGFIATTAEEATEHFGKNACDEAACLASIRDKGEGEWLVWSEEHQAWWAPNECGYTSFIAKAGRYSKLRADNICFHANGGGIQFHEIAIPAPAGIPAPPRNGGLAG